MVEAMRISEPVVQELSSMVESICISAPMVEPEYNGKVPTVEHNSGVPIEGQMCTTASKEGRLSYVSRSPNLVEHEVNMMVPKVKHEVNSMVPIVEPSYATASTEGRLRYVSRSPNLVEHEVNIMVPTVEPSYSMASTDGGTSYVSRSSNLLEHRTNTGKTLECAYPP